MAWDRDNGPSKGFIAFLGLLAVAGIMFVSYIGKLKDEYTTHVVISAEAGTKLHEATREARTAEESLLGLAREACMAAGLQEFEKIEACAAYQLRQAKNGEFSHYWKLIDP